MENIFLQAPAVLFLLLKIIEISVPEVTWRNGSSFLIFIIFFLTAALRPCCRKHCCQLADWLSSPQTPPPSSWCRAVGGGRGSNHCNAFSLSPSFFLPLPFPSSSSLLPSLPPSLSLFLSVSVSPSVSVAQNEHNTPKNHLSLKKDDMASSFWWEEVQKFTEFQNRREVYKMSAVLLSPLD